MNEKIKKVFSYIIAFLSGIFTCICGWLLSCGRNRPVTDGTRNGIDEARKSVESAGNGIDRSEERIEECENGIGELQESIGRSREIIEEIRSKKRD